MPSPFIPVLAALLVLVGFAVGALIVWLSLRVFGTRGAPSTGQAEVRTAEHAAVAAEHAAQAQELARLRTEHDAVVSHRETLRTTAEELRLVHARVETELHVMRASQGSLEEAAARAIDEHRRMQADRAEAQAALRAVTAQLAAERESSQHLMQAERAAAEEKLLLLAEARVELSNQFKTLAAEIFEEKSKRFGEQNTASMDSLLSPLREKLGDFQQRVEALKEDGIAGRSELKTQIEGLRLMNERLSLEASSLVAALKGSSKTQGDWGEMLLEQMLEDAGLRSGHEYQVQESYTREDGTRARPDVIVRLPQTDRVAKHLVIDAKISLLDYNAYCDCQDETSRSASLARHVSSIRQHLRGLAKKDYHNLYELQSIDFVIMFVPIEPAYLLALSRDSRLWQDAWESSVLLVSPGSLFPVIRTVAHLWRQEQQNRNVEDIVDRGALLYDKLAAFAADMVKVGAGLDTAREAYDKAMNKLSTGRGNAIGQAEKLKALGVKASKRMPREMVEALQEDLAHALAEQGEEVPGTTRELFD